MDDGSDLATAHLPPDAARPRFTMNRQRDRDQVACLLGRDGWRAFERPLPELIFRYGVAHPGLFVDVGANTGFYTLLAASASRDNHVVALEPMADILELLRRNLADNDLVDRVRLIRCAAGERNGEQDLYVPSPAHRLIETSASLLGSFKGEHSSTERVLVRTLDRILFRPSLIGRRVTMIKIDVEGHEAAVIAGARWTVRRHRPIVFAEVLPHADFDALNRFLDLNRYVDVRLGPERAPEIASRVSFDPDGWNHALVPVDKVASFSRAIDPAASGV